MNASELSNYSGNKTVLADKTNNPTLLDLMGDEMASNAPSMKDVIYKSNLEDEIKRERQKADPAIAENKI